MDKAKELLLTVGLIAVACAYAQMDYPGPLPGMLPMNPANSMYIPNVYAFDQASLNSYLGYSNEPVPVPRIDNSQVPPGWEKASPIGVAPDGLPVYGLMPVFNNVRGEFYYFDSQFTHRLYHFPADRRGRVKQGQKVFQIMSNMNNMIQSAAFSASLDPENEKHLHELREKDRKRRDADHKWQMEFNERRRLHMNEAQYRKYKEGWRPVVPAGQLDMEIGTPDWLYNPSNGDVIHIP